MDHGAAGAARISDLAIGATSPNVRVVGEARYDAIVLCETFLATV